MSVQKQLLRQVLGVLHNGGRMGFMGVPHYNNRALGFRDLYRSKYLSGRWSGLGTTYDKRVLLKAVMMVIPIGRLYLKL